jgi:hypothetical protein
MVQVKRHEIFSKDIVIKIDELILKLYGVLNNGTS